MKFFGILVSLLPMVLVVVTINGASFGNDLDGEDDLSLNVPIELAPDEENIHIQPFLPIDNDEGLEAGLIHRQRRQSWWPFGGGKDTNSNSAREAFRNAKDQNGIPRSQQPNAQYTVPDKNNPNKMLRQYDYVNSQGNKVSIRKDLPVKYPDGGTQGPHYNAGPSGEKLKQHHNFPARRRG